MTRPGNWEARFFVALKAAAESAYVLSVNEYAGIIGECFGLGLRGSHPGK